MQRDDSAGSEIAAIQNQMITAETQRLMLEELRGIKETLGSNKSSGETSGRNTTFNNMMMNGSVEAERAAKESVFSIKNQMAALSSNPFLRGNLYAGRGVSPEEKEILQKQDSNNFSNAVWQGTTGAGVFGAEMGAGFLGGSLVGSVALGTGVGLVAGAVVGNAFEQRKQHQEYEIDFMRDSYRFINPYETKNREKGKGFTNTESSLAADFMRTVNSDQYLRDADVREIFAGGMENNLLRSTSDLESFKKNMTKLIEKTKEGAIMVNATFKEITDFMGAMKSAGIDTNYSTSIFAAGKVAGSFTGKDAKNATAEMISHTQDITRGTTIDANKELIGYAAFSSFTANARENLMKDSPYANNFKNMKADDISNIISASMTNSMSSGVMQSYLGAAADVDEKGRAVIDSKKLNDIASGKYSQSEISNMVMDGKSDSFKHLWYNSKQDFINEVMTNEFDAMKLINKAASDAMGSTDPAKLKTYFSSQYGWDSNTADMFLGLTNHLEKNPDFEKDFKLKTARESARATAEANKYSFTDQMLNIKDKLSDQMGGFLSTPKDETIDDPFDNKNNEAFYYNKNYAPKYSFDYFGKDFFEGMSLSTATLGDKHLKDVPLQDSSFNGRGYNSGIQNKIDGLAAKIAELQTFGGDEKQIINLQREKSVLERDKEIRSTFQTKKAQLGNSLVDVFAGVYGDSKVGKEYQREVQIKTGHASSLGPLFDHFAKTKLRDETAGETQKRFIDVQEWTIDKIDRDKGKFLEYAKSLGLNTEEYHGLKTREDKVNLANTLMNAMEANSPDGSSTPTASKVEKALKTRSDELEKLLNKIMDSIEKDKDLYTSLNKKMNVFGR